MGHFEWYVFGFAAALLILLQAFVFSRLGYDNAGYLMLASFFIGFMLRAWWKWTQEERRP